MVWRLRARGQVQGVGFRPFAALLARRHGLRGHVRNDGAGAELLVEGPPAAVEAFCAALVAELPAPGRVDELFREEVAGSLEPGPFRIARSAGGAAGADVTVDCALCPECLRELFDPADRRHRYPLITCTRCGPRYTIALGVPWDRPRTTMATFPLCDACTREYEAEDDRRYHAQPTCCSACGPRVRLVDPRGDELDGPALGRAAALLAEGAVLAVKGLGGYHLAVRADDEAAVQRLRLRKGRDAKPFALLVADATAAQSLVALGPAGLSLLGSAIAPIVLAPRLPGASVAPSVAPGTHRLGVMLPATPLQHLLLAEAPLRAVPLVMTSGNRSDEPLVADDGEALLRLGPLCEALLVHDRPIARAVDDSVVLELARGAPLLVRRARGYVPAPVRLPWAGEVDGLATGGDLKAVVGVLRQGRALLGQHLGDLAHPGARRAFARNVDELLALFGVRPRFVAHDLHPDYHSHQEARRLASALGVPLFGVQHHHAHAASVLAEHGLAGPVVAVTCDGTGYGADGGVWGGEVLVGGLAGFRRVGRLRPLPLPGGDAASRDGRRPALGLLSLSLGAGYAEHPAALALWPDACERRVVARLLERGVHCPLASSTGRLFDAVAALLGLAARNRHEAEAPLALEAAAAAASGEALDAEPFGLGRAGDLWELDPVPFVGWLLRARAEGAPVAALAAAFHDGLARGLASLAGTVARTEGLAAVALSGGAFCNERLTLALTEALSRQGLRVLRPERVPANDGGLALGQLALAAAAVVS